MRKTKDSDFSALQALGDEVLAAKAAGEDQRAASALADYIDLAARFGGDDPAGLLSYGSTTLVAERSGSRVAAPTPPGTNASTQNFAGAGGDTGALNSWSIEVLTCTEGLPESVPVPTLNGWSIVLMALILLLAGTGVLYRRFLIAAR